MKLGLVLSGGSAKCIAHIGVIKALEETGIRPDIISASSGGALVGVLYASGVCPEEALEHIVKQNTFKFFYPSARTGGLFSLTRIEKAFIEVLKIKTFEELNIPLIIATTDIVHGESVFFSKGELIKPLMASASYPGIFEPVEINGRQLLDGGIMNNFPIEPIREQCDKIIGVSVGKIYKLDQMGSVQKVIVRSLELAINESDLRRFMLCDLLIEPPGLNSFGMFESDKGKEIFQKGYEHTIRMVREIEKIVA